MLPDQMDILNLPFGTRSTIPPLNVVPEAAQRWQAALQRGIEHALTVERREATELYDVQLVAYLVQSYTTRELLHPVVIALDPAHMQVSTICDCEAGTFGKPCQHAALAIDAEGWWMPGMGILRQTTLAVAPVETLPVLPDPRFRPGQVVKRSGGHTLFIVHQRTPQEGRWHYHLLSLANVPCGSFAEEQLVPGMNKRRRAA